MPAAPTFATACAASPPRRRAGTCRSARVLGLIAALACWLPTLQASAAVPSAAWFEGALRSAGGGPAADGAYKLTFSLYAAAQNGSALWQESGVDVQVTNGAFAYALGSKTPLDPKLLTGNLWLGIQVGAEPELPRVALQSVAFAQRAAIAEAIDCTGCVASSALTFTGDLDLGGNSLKAKNITASGDLVAKAVTAASFVGDGSKLTGLAKANTSCKTGQAVTGIAGDGSLICGAVGSSADVLGGKLTDVMTEFAAPPGLPVAIPDNTGAEAVAIATFGDVGTAASVSLHIKLSNTDLSAVRIVVLPPDDKVKGLTICDPCGAANAKSYDAVLTNKSTLKSGTLATYDGQPLKGTWTLKVLDTDFCAPQAPGNKDLCDTVKSLDGAIEAFDVNASVTASQSVRTTGTFQFGLFTAAPFACTPSKKGHAFFETSSGQLHLCDGTAWRQVQTASLCGNKVVNGGEQCDDGNNVDTDACTNACKTNVCGDGIVHAGVEQCDDGNSVDNDACSNACKAAFTTVTFTPCSASGVNGPSQTACNSAYANSTLAGKVTVTGGVQKWIVPFSGTYTLEAFGAKGGDAPGFPGGKGARMKGTFALKEGDVLWIAVGQSGGNSQSAGGGGGTFVGLGATLLDATPLLVAGGGGGGRSSSLTGPGLPGNTTTSGTAGTYPGGTNGNGGTRNGGTVGGFAGGGFYTDGQQNASNSGRSGTAFIKGALGGVRQDNGANLCADGGYGGGGGGMHNQNQGSGGGGGYSGGGAGHDSGGPGYGGGGGSFNKGSAQDNATGFNNADGKLTIGPG